MLNKEELESALACAGHCCDCEMPLPDEEFACEHTLAETAIAEQQEIERLRAELAALQAKYDELNDFEHSQCAKLLAKLSESRRRERAAVEDMKVMALAMRESEELPEGCCFACAYDAQNLPDNVILAYGECPGYDRDDCFEWRGPQETGKGEAK